MREACLTQTYCLQNKALDWALSKLSADLPQHSVTLVCVGARISVRAAAGEWNWRLKRRE